MTTTDSQIRKLRTEAAEAGDLAQVALCDTALGRRTADAWWRWHDQRTWEWSQTVEEAEGRCDAWVAGASDEGPDEIDARARCAEVIAYAQGEAEVQS